MRGHDEAAAGHVQLPVARGARAAGSSVAHDPGDGRRGAPRAVAHFDALYAGVGRPSIPPEQLVRALLLQILYTVRSERLLMEELHYNLLFRWFVGLNMDDGSGTRRSSARIGSAAGGRRSGRVFGRVLAQAERQLLSDEHFTVDGTLIEAWASRRSFHEKKDPPPARARARGNESCCGTRTRSKTDPEARLYKRSTAGEAKPSYLGHVIMENRNGLVVAAVRDGVGHAAEREAALEMLRGNVAEAESGNGEADHAGSGQGVSGRRVHRADCGRASDPAHGRV